MKWLLILTTFLSLNAYEKCNESMDKQVKKEQTQNIEHKEVNSQKGQMPIIGKWAESGIDEDGRIFKLPPSRGGLEFYTFNADGTVKYDGAVNCGMGNYFLGTYTISPQNKLTITYTQKKQYVGDKPIEDADFSQKFTIIRLDEKAMVLEKMKSDGTFEIVALIPIEIYKALEFKEYIEE